MSGALLLQAAQYGNLEKFIQNHQSGVDINYADSYGRTALLYAAREDFIEIVTYCIEKYANLEARTESQRTALIYATHEGHFNVVKALIDAGANVNAADSCGYTALMIAANNGNVPILNLLLQANANVHMKDVKGNSAVELAKNNGVRLLLENYRLDDSGSTIPLSASPQSIAQAVENNKMQTTPKSSEAQLRSIESLNKSLSKLQSLAQI